nr:MAG TPA: hypothetical protein [Caudoviricetes sp.]
MRSYCSSQHITIRPICRNLIGISDKIKPRIYVIATGG